jgi:ribosomal protein S16
VADKIRHKRLGKIHAPYNRVDDMHTRTRRAATPGWFAQERNPLA